MTDYEEKLEAYRKKVREDYARRRAILERRRHTRIDARVPVLFETPDDFVQAYTHNLSKGGLYFETPERLSPNGRLELILSPPGSEHQVRVIARVVRMITRYQEQADGSRVRMNGYGVRFEKLRDEDAKALESFFEKLQAEVTAADAGEGEAAGEAEAAGEGEAAGEAEAAGEGEAAGEAEAAGEGEAASEAEAVSAGDDPAGSRRESGAPPSESTESQS